MASGYAAVRRPTRKLRTEPKPVVKHHQSPVILKTSPDEVQQTYLPPQACGINPRSTNPFRGRQLGVADDRRRGIGWQVLRRRHGDHPVTNYRGGRIDLEPIHARSPTGGTDRVSCSRGDKVSTSRGRRRDTARSACRRKSNSEVRVRKGAMPAGDFQPCTATCSTRTSRLPARDDSASSCRRSTMTECSHRQHPDSSRQRSGHRAQA